MTCVTLKSNKTSFTLAHVVAQFVNKLLRVYFLFSHLVVHALFVFKIHLLLSRSKHDYSHRPCTSTTSLACCSVYSAQS